MPKSFPQSVTPRTSANIERQKYRYVFHWRTAKNKAIPKFTERTRGTLLKPPKVRHKNVFLWEFIDPPPQSNMVSNQRFENCRIIGPSLIAVDGKTELTDCSLRTPHEEGATFHDLVRFNERNSEIVGALRVRDCAFIRCVFMDVGFIVPEEQRAHWITRFRHGAYGADI